MNPWYWLPSQPTLSWVLNLCLSCYTGLLCLSKFTKTPGSLKLLINSPMLLLTLVLTWLNSPGYVMDQLILWFLGPDTISPPTASILTRLIKHVPRNVQIQGDPLLIWVLLANTLLVPIALIIICSRNSGSSINQLQKTTISTPVVVFPSPESATKVGEIIEDLRLDFKLAEILAKSPLTDSAKVDKLIQTLPKDLKATAVHLLSEDPTLADDYERYSQLLVKLPSKTSIPLPVAIQQLGNLKQGNEKSSTYYSRFLELTEAAKISAKEAEDLYFQGLKPDLLNAITI